MEVERSDYPSHPTIEVIIEGQNFKLLQILKGCNWKVQALRKRNREKQISEEKWN